MRSARQGALRAAGLGYAVTMLGTTLPTPLYPIYMRRFGLTTGDITAIFATYAAALLIVLPVAGRLVDRRPGTWPLTGALLLAAAGNVVFLLADGSGALFLARILGGAAAGLYTAAGTKVMTELIAGDTRRAAVMSTASSMGGLALGPLLAGLLATYATAALRLPFIVALSLDVVALLLVAATIARWPAPGAAAARPDPAAASSPGRGSPADAAGRLGPLFVRVAAAAFSGFALLGLFTSLVPAVLIDRDRITSPAAPGAVAALILASSAVSQSLLRSIPDRAAVGAGAALTGAGALALATAAGTGSLVILIAAAVVGGLGQGLALMGAVAVLSRRAAASRRARVISSLYVAAYLGVALPVLGVGALTGPLGLAGATLAFALVIGGVSLLVALDSVRSGARRIYPPAHPCTAAIADAAPALRISPPTTQGA